GAGRPAAGSVTSNVANGFEQPSTASDRASPVPRRIAPRTMCLMAARSCSAHARAPSSGKVDGPRRYDPPGAGTTRASVRASLGAALHGTRPSRSGALQDTWRRAAAGALTFPAFRKYVIEVAATRILPFLNIGATGMLSAEVGELEELRFIDRTKALQSIEANRGLIRGVKVRLSRQQVGPNARVALLTARET